MLYLDLKWLLLIIVIVSLWKVDVISSKEMLHVYSVLGVLLEYSFANLYDFQLHLEEKVTSLSQAL